MTSNNDSVMYGCFSLYQSSKTSYIVIQISESFKTYSISKLHHQSVICTIKLLLIMLNAPNEMINCYFVTMQAHGHATCGYPSLLKVFIIHGFFLLIIKRDEIPTLHS